jgi:GntR family transcriptional regulator
MAESYPRYLQIAEELEKQVRGSAVNTLLPTEEQLSARFQVSRATLRRALEVLEREGLISRSRGRGTLVRPAKFVRHLVPPRTIEQDFYAQNLDMHTAVLSLEKLAHVDAGVRDQLALTDGQPVARLMLTRAVDYETIVFERRCFPAEFADRLDTRGLGVKSVSALLETIAAGKIETSDIESEILPCPRSVAEHLKVAPGVLVVVQHFREVLVGGRPLQVGTMFYRADRVRFSISVKGAPFARTAG